MLEAYDRKEADGEVHAKNLASDVLGSLCHPEEG
jgi:hypothetical protein